MNKERLSELLNMLAMGRRDAVEELVDMLTDTENIDHLLNSRPGPLIRVVSDAQPVPSVKFAPVAKPKGR